MLDLGGLRASGGCVAGADWITSQLAVGGSLPRFATRRRLARVGIGAVIDLRSEDCDDCDGLARGGIAFLHLPTADYDAPAQAMLDEGVAFARHWATRSRVLIHCQHGMGRSACLALCVLVDLGRSPSEALSLLKARRERISPSPAQYQAWSEWLRRRDREPPPWEEFCAVAYRHLHD